MNRSPLLLAVSMLAVSMLVVALAGAVLAEEEVPAPPPQRTHGELAEAILEGSDAEMADAATAVGAFDQGGRLRVFYELREQARIRGALDHAVVGDVSMKGVDLDSSLKALLEPWGVEWHVSQALRARHYETIMIKLDLSDVSVTQVLALLTEPHGIRALIRADGIWLVSADEGEGGVEPASSIALRAKLQTTTLTLEIDDISFAEVLEYVQVTTGIEVRVDPGVPDDVADYRVQALHVDDMPVRFVLDLLAGRPGFDLVWQVKGDAVVFSSSIPKGR